MSSIAPDDGLWALVLLNSAVFIIFAFMRDAPQRTPRRGDW